jgi:hypothetical protein
MEYNSSINLNKDLVSIIDNNTLFVYDSSKKVYIQNYTFTDDKIKTSVVKIDSQNSELIYILVSDSKGNLHVINVNKNEKISKLKLHDEEILNFKVSQSKNLVYTLDRNGVIKVTDFINGETKQTLNLKNKDSQNQNKSKFYHFDVDFNDKNIVFNKNLKIKLYNLENNQIEKLGAHSSDISFLSFSSDGKFVISMTNKDYFINLWYKKNKNEPLMTLQKNSLTVLSEMKLMEKGVYHLFSYNKSIIYGYKLILDEIDPTVPVKPNFEIEFPEKNLIKCQISNNEVDNKKFAQNLFVIYGKAFNASSLHTRLIKYSKNARNFKEFENYKITSKDHENDRTVKKGVNVSNSVTILNEIQMSGNFENQTPTSTTDNENENVKITPAIENKKTPKKSEEEKNISLTDEKISLLNIIKNSIINNDNNTFQWALDQKDINLIENTVKKMETEILRGFISKLIEVFQSNAFFKRNILPWLQFLFKYHQLEIINLPAKTLVSLRSIQTLIRNRTKNFDRLLEVSSKVENLMNNFKSKAPVKEEKFQNYEPLLVYNESDDEDEKKEKENIKNKLQTQGIKKTKICEFINKKRSDFEKDTNMFEDEDVGMDEILDEDMAMEDEPDEDKKMQVDDIDEEEEDFSDEDA